MKVVLLALVLGGALLLNAGCATTKDYSGELPPILAQDEVLHSYQKVAVLEVHRTRYGSPADLKPEDYSWGYRALREEAGRINADAVILPEVTIDLERYLLFPVSDMKATGVAIKFK